MYLLLCHTENPENFWWAGFKFSVFIYIISQPNLWSHFLTEYELNNTLEQLIFISQHGKYNNIKVTIQMKFFQATSKKVFIDVIL